MEYFVYIYLHEPTLSVKPRVILVRVWFLYCSLDSVLSNQQPNFNVLTIVDGIIITWLCFHAIIYSISASDLAKVCRGARRKDSVTMHKVPSLVDLCVQVAIYNVRYLGDVGETDLHLLDRILSHCTLDQLTHIENCTEGRDLSPVTDKLWEKFYKVQFGDHSANIVIKKMRQHKVTFNWRQLYEAKVKEREEATQKSLDRLKQRYKEEDARKQSRQVKLCTKTPPSSKKRSFFGGAIANNIYNTKSNLLKKAKLDLVNSREFKNRAAMNNKTVQRNFSVSTIRKPVAPGIASSSSSKPMKPVHRK